MCGIFGIIRNQENTTDGTLRGTEALLMLGIKAEERGIDAAGIALINTSFQGTLTIPTKEHAEAKKTNIDNTVIIKDAVPFHKLPIKNNLKSIDKADVIIGHTRAASQGKADSVINASPLIAGALIGTHNGDVDTTSIPNFKNIQKKVFGETDTEVLYKALNKERKDRREMVKILKTVEGRAALIFVDRTRPDRLYIARTALSPVSYAYTENGDFVYASNPDWFRQIEKETQGRVTFKNITLIPEGYLLTVNTKTREVENTRKFKPTCREKDLYIINSVVYRKFKLDDKQADKTLHCHKIATQKTKTHGKLTPAPTIIETAAITADNSDMLWSAETTWDGEKFIPPAEELVEWIVDEKELEALCWASGDFDTDTYLEILEANPEEGVYMLEEYRKTVQEAYDEGLTAPGFTMTNEEKTV